jgi:hypothetical protein
MTNSLRFILAASVIAFIAGSTDAGSVLAWGILKPVSALLFGTFFIGQLLHNESVKFDEERRLLIAKAQTSTSPAAKKTAQCCSDSTLATAH